MQSLSLCRTSSAMRRERRGIRNGTDGGVPSARALTNPPRNDRKCRFCDRLVPLLCEDKTATYPPRKSLSERFRPKQIWSDLRCTEPTTASISLDLNTPYHPPLNFGICPVTCGVKRVNMAKQRVGQQRVSSLDSRPLNSKA